MADGSYKSKVYRAQGGDQLVVASGGEIKVESGGIISANGTQASAQAAALTTITITDTNGADYAFSALTTSSPYGLATQAEAQALLYVLQNLQVRLATLETACKNVGITA